MSEEAKVSPDAKVKKKKGKLPVILVLVLLLAGGGFFMKSKGAPKKVAIKAGTIEALDKEFLINLASGPNTYLRAEIAFRLRDGFTKEKLDESMPAIRDCINDIFRSKSLQEVGSDQTLEIRKEIASSVNEILVDEMKPEEKKAQAELEKAAAEPKTEAKKPIDPKAAKELADRTEWVSAAGPVLNVYFTSFTTQ